MFREQLILRALAALSEIADECGERPVPKSLSLRFLLAYNFVAAGADPKLKWIWTSFWESDDMRQACRWPRRPRPRHGRTVSTKRHLPRDRLSD